MVAYLLEGIIAAVVVFFGLLGVMMLFDIDLDIKISLGIIFVLIAVTIALGYFGGVLIVGACIAIAIIIALLSKHVVENISMV
jgi:hypothetical protein